jgi:hypothetical protein
MRTFFALLLACCCTQALGQKSSRNNLYVEGLGATGYYSLNYERVQPFFRHRLVLLTAGTGFSRIKHDGDRWVSLPFRASLCVGRKWYGEVGYNFVRSKAFSRSFLHPDQWIDWGWYNFRFWHMGIRYQARKKDLFIRTFVFPLKVNVDNSPLLFHLDRDFYQLRAEGQKFILWGGLDIGYSF